MTKPIHEMASPLVEWYKQHERSFPWRENPSPYRVWVSEIMLQQTRIEAALPYFERFMQALPTIYDLSVASEDVLLKLWEGLGYYSRVRNLQKAAQIVMTEFGGELPDSYEALLSLPGIGEYTAGAIASIAFGKRAAAVDGNVLRVMARITDDDTDVMQPKNRKRLTKLVQSLVPEGSAGEFNQGIMELGETICLPNAQPHCSDCPISAYCAVAGQERARNLPTRTPPKARRIEKLTVFVVVTQEPPKKVILHHRPPKGLLGGMWEFPNCERDKADEFLSDLGIEPITTSPLPNSKHVFSHVEWHMDGIIVKIKSFTENNAFKAVSKEELPQYALPTAFRTYNNYLIEEDVL